MLEHDGHESIRRPGLSSDIQRAIGQRLRQHYAYVNTTLLSNLCPRGWLTLSRSLSNEATRPRQLPESYCCARSTSNAVDLTLSHGAAWEEETVCTMRLKAVVPHRKRARTLQWPISRLAQLESSHPPKWKT
jgi:hypothetical protein